MNLVIQITTKDGSKYNATQRFGEMQIIFDDGHVCFRDEQGEITPLSEDSIQSMEVISL